MIPSETSLASEKHNLTRKLNATLRIESISTKGSASRSLGPPHPDLPPHFAAK